MSRPGRAAWLWLVAWAAPRRLRAAILGDLEEEWRQRAERLGHATADAWLRGQALRSLRPLLSIRSARTADTRHPSSPARRTAVMGNFLQDLRFTGRLLGRAPAFVLLVVLTIGLGIAANTVVFSVVDGVVLNPFPFPEPDRLVGVGSAYPRIGEELGFWENLSPAEFVDVRDGARTLERVVAWDMGHRQVSVEGRSENLFSAFWWGDAFPTLGVTPVEGRGFSAVELEEGARVAILSHRVWTERFGADPSLVGAPIHVNGEPYTLVGVMPRRTLIYGTDLWLPMPIAPEAYARDRRQFQLLARLAPGATLQDVNAELDVLARRVEGLHGPEIPSYEGWAMRAMTWTDVNVRTMRLAAFILLGAVGFVLLLVCTNVAGLLLGRAAGRRRELAVRMALGAGRGRIVRQLLTESVALAVIGGVVGVGLGWVGVGAVTAAMSTMAIPIPGEVSMSGRVLAFSALVALGAGLLFGILPALQAVRSDVRGTLQAEGATHTGSRGRLRVQRLLVAVEVAVALVLLTGGGLLIHSFLRVRAVDPGFRAENVLTMRLTLARERYPAERMEPFFRELADRVAQLPGVSGSAVASQLPPNVFTRQTFQVEGMAPRSQEDLPSAFTTIASPDYFETLGIPLVRGRTLARSDVEDGPPVAVVNQAAADRWFPGVDPVGRRLAVGGEQWFEVVGVVGNTRNTGAEAAPAPEIFASTRQLPRSWNQLFLLVRTRGAPYGVLGGVRDVVRSLDPEQPVYAIRTIEEAYAESQAQRRVATTALTLFGGFALLLAALGIYAVASQAVAQRTREIGLRVALGARRGQVLRLVVRQSLLPVLLGGLAGVAGALMVGSFLRGLLFEVGSVDGPTLGTVVLLLAGVAFLACWIPARRAARLDPMTALEAGR
jgi:predicted permease